MGKYHRGGAGFAGLDAPMADDHGRPRGHVRPPREQQSWVPVPSAGLPWMLGGPGDCSAGGPGQGGVALCAHCLGH